MAELSKNIKTQDYQYRTYLGLMKVHLAKGEYDRTRDYYNKYILANKLESTIFEQIRLLFIHTEVELNAKNFEIFSVSLDQNKAAWIKAIAQDKLENILTNHFPDATIKIIDLANDQDHYSIEIQDEIFRNKSRIEQHKIVNSALKEELKGQLHAMQLKTKAP